MRLSTHRAAVLAAAKVSLFAGIAGCSGGVTQVSGYQDPATSTPGGDAVGVMPLPPIANGGSSSHAECAVTPSQPANQDVFDCCDDKLAPSFPADGFASELPADVAADPNAIACCSAIIDHVDQDLAGSGPDRMVDYDRASIGGLLASCCNAVGKNDGSSPGCTPWGPPMPPEMFDALEVA